MGGLGEASEASVLTGINEVDHADNSVLTTTYVNLQGMRVNAAAKGVVIKIETLNNGKRIATRMMK